MVTRRNLLRVAAGACAGGVLSGCGLGQTMRTVVPTRLQVLVLGLGDQGGPAMQGALRQAADAYIRSGRGFVLVDVHTVPLPPLSWYACSPIGPCGPGTPLRSLGFRTGPVVTLSGQTVTLQGRTALDMGYGGQPPPPAPAVDIVDPPDVVVAFDVWAYWLAPFALDWEPVWRGGADDRAQLPSGLQAHGRAYANGVGTFFASLPLLRNPMVIHGPVPGGTAPAADTKQPWTWAQLAAAIDASSAVGSMWGFIQQAWSTDGTDLASAVVAAHGGAIARATASAVNPAFQDTPAVTGLGLLVGMMQGVRGVAPDSAYAAAQAAYLTDPFGVGRSSPMLSPLPAGPAGRAVPCTYVCAWAFSAARHHQATTDFCSYLLSPTGQGYLAGADAGLVLRPGDAARQLGAPSLRAVRPAEIADSTADLTVARLYGGEKTDENGHAFDAVADAFARAVGALENPPVAVGQVPSVLGDVVTRQGLG